MAKLSKTGYKKTSKDRNEPSLLIPGPVITMNNVPHPVIGIADTGEVRIMYPGEDHNFDGANHVHEIPMKKGGPTAAKAKEMLRDGTANGRPLTDDQKRYFGWIAGGKKQKGGEMKKLKKGGIHIKKSKVGTFTAAATKHGMGVQEFAHQVLSHPENYSGAMRKKANFARNASHWNHQLGGGVGELLNNPIIKFAAPLAANAFFPGSGALVGPALNMSGNEQSYDMSSFGNFFSNGGQMKKFVKNYSHGGAPQGFNMDEYIQKKKNEFVDYISANNMTSLFKNETMSLQKQQGGQSSDGYPDWMAQTQFPDMMMNNANTPSVTSPPTKMVPDSDPNAGYPSWMLETQFPDMVMSNQPPVPTTTSVVQPTNKQKGSPIPAPGELGRVPGLGSDIAYSAMSTFNGLYDRQEAIRKQQWLNKQMTLENIAPTNYGSRGDYDVNQGDFRPDQKTPAMFKKGGAKKLKCGGKMYKKGGTYADLSSKDISDLLSQGYQFEFVD